MALPRASLVSVALLLSILSSAMAFTPLPSSASSLASRTELGVLRRLFKKDTPSFREQEPSEDGTSPLMEGVKKFGMAFKMEDWKHCIDTEECEVPEELFGNPTLGAGSDGAKFDSLNELRDIVQLKKQSASAPQEAA